MADLLVTLRGDPDCTGIEAGGLRVGPGHRHLPRIFGACRSDELRLALPGAGHFSQAPTQFFAPQRLTGMDWIHGARGTLTCFGMGSPWAIGRIS